MKRFGAATRIATVSFLIFVNSIVVFGQTGSIYRLPAGTRIRLRMEAEVNSRASRANDTFITAVVKPVTVREVVVIPADTIIEGRVIQASGAAFGGQNGKLDVIFETLKFGDDIRRIEGIVTQPFVSRSSNAFSLLSILGGAIAGAAVGAANSAKGALIGAGVGAGAGTSIALVRKGREVRIRKGEEFEIELRKEVLLPVLDY